LREAPKFRDHTAQSVLDLMMLLDLLELALDERPRSVGLHVTVQIVGNCTRKGVDLFGFLPEE